MMLHKSLSSMNQDDRKSEMDYETLWQFPRLKKPNLTLGITARLLLNMLVIRCSRSTISRVDQMAIPDMGNKDITL